MLQYERYTAGKEDFLTVIPALEPAPCINHPRRVTGLRCGKCGNPICTQCMIQTPVGVRCRTCAQLRRLPQFDVDLTLLLRSGGAGLAVSFLAWLVIAYIPFLSFFLAIIVGVAVGEVMSRLARRRSSRALDVTAVLAVVIGLLAAYALLGGLPTIAQGLLMSPRFLIRLLVPAAIASFVAVIKLR